MCRLAKKRTQRVNCKYLKLIKIDIFAFLLQNSLIIDLFSTGVTTTALTATSGSDYTAMNGDTQTMVEWQTRLVVPVAISNDNDEEVAEAFEVRITVTPRGESNIATVVDPDVTTVTIRDGK